MDVSITLRELTKKRLEERCAALGLTRDEFVSWAVKEILMEYATFNRGLDDNELDDCTEDVDKFFNEYCEVFDYEPCFIDRKGEYIYFEYIDNEDIKNASLYVYDEECDFLSLICNYPAESTSGVAVKTLFDNLWRMVVCRRQELDLLFTQSKLQEGLNR